MSKESEKIIERTPEEQLIAFKNGHLKDFIAAFIRLEMASQYDENEDVGFKQIQHGNMVSTVPVKAKDIIRDEKLNLKSNANFLIAIEKVSEEFRKNKEVWKTKI